MFPEKAPDTQGIAAAMDVEPSAAQAGNRNPRDYTGSDQGDFTRERAAIGGADARHRDRPQSGKGSSRGFILNDRDYILQKDVKNLNTRERGPRLQWSRLFCCDMTSSPKRDTKGS
jgi:hypothetical protein